MSSVKYAESIYKKSGISIYIPQGGYGIRSEPPVPYQYPKGHPCGGCPYTLNAPVPTCMFPARTDGGCFWYDRKRLPKPALPDNGQKRAAEKVRRFIKILESVKRRKGCR